MEQIVCIQYEIGDFDGKFKPVTHFAKSLNDVFTKFAFGRNGYCKAVAGWRIKQTTYSKQDIHNLNNSAFGVFYKKQP